MAALSLIIVLEHWFQVDAPDVNSLFILFENLAEIAVITVA